MAFPRDEQVSLVDRAGLGIGRNGYTSAFGGDEFAAARYGAAQQPAPQPTTANHAFPSLYTDSDGRAWMNLITKSGSIDVSKCRFDYPDYDGAGSSELWTDQPTKLGFQFEMQFDHGSGGVAGNANMVQVDDAAGNQTILRANSSEQFVLRYYNGSGYTNLLFEPSQRAIGNASTYTFWLFIDTDNNTLDLWHAPGSITDVDIIGATALTVTKNPWSGGAQVTDLGMGAIASFGFFSGGTSNATADLNLRARCVHTQHTAFSPEPDGTFSLFDLHRKLTEKSTPYYDDAESKYVLASTCNVPVGIYPCGTTCNASLVVYPSLTDYENDTNAVATVTPAAVSLLHNYRRLTQRTGAVLAPSTTYVYCWKLTLQDASYNSNASYTVTGLPCYVRTAPAKGEAFPETPHFEVSSCRHQDYFSNSGSRERAREGWADDRCRFLLDLGDSEGGGYMDEVRYVGKTGDWNGSGSGPVTAETATGSGGLGKSAEGAETRQQMADQAAMLAHADHALEEARYWSKFFDGDDHDRSVNDMATMDMLQENRDDNGSGVKITPWRKGNKGVTHSRYPSEIGGPLDGLRKCAIEWFADIGGGNSPEYDGTPREVAETIIAHFAEWGLPTMPDVASGLRLDASAFNKYGSTPFSATDAGYYYTYLGDVMLLSLDTRLSMTWWPNAPWGDGGASFFSWAKQWVLDTIEACEVSGLIICIPGYLEGYSRGGLKGFDNIGWVMGTTNTDSETLAIRAEAIEIFKTAIDANPAIKWCCVMVGDHHFASLDNTVTNSFSSKFRMQLADGGGHSIVQDIEALGQEGDPDYDINEGALGEDYTWLTAFGLESGGIRSRTRFELENAATGAGTARLWNCAGASQSLVQSAAIEGVPTSSASASGAGRTRRLLASGILEGAEQ